MDEQLKLSHKVVDVVDRASRKIYMTVLRYNLDKPESSFGQVLLFARKKEDKKFQQIVFVTYKLKVINLFDLMNSLLDKVLTNKHICIVL